MELMMLEHARMSTRATTVLQNHIKAQDIHISLLDEVIEERGARIKILEKINEMLMPLHQATADHPKQESSIRGTK